MISKQRRLSEKQKGPSSENLCFPTCISFFFSFSLLVDIATYTYNNTANFFWQPMTFGDSDFYNAKKN